MTDPSEQALPFSEAAILAATRTLWTYDDDAPAAQAELRRDMGAALTAAVNADPRLAACLKLAALSDEELRRRVAVHIACAFPVSDDPEGDFAGAFDDARRADRYAAVALAALGLPVAEQHNHDASGIYSDCPACRTVLAKQEPTGGEG